MAHARVHRLARAGQVDLGSKNLRFTNSAEANKYVKPAFRKGSDLKL